MARVPTDPSAPQPAAGDPSLVPFTSPWWLDRLGKQLDSDRLLMARVQSYYNGAQPLAMATQRFREAFGQTFAKWSDNFMRMVVQALEERLTVEAFRWNNQKGADDAWDIWQANNLDAQSQKGHREAIIKGRCPVIVGPPTVRGGEPIIRIQKPEEVTIAYDDDPLKRAVALKRWTTADGVLLATLYYPDRLEKYQAASTPARATGSGPIVPWDRREVAGEEWPLRHSLEAVPVVDIVNDPDIDNGGHSEIEPVLPLQDAVNKLFVDLIVASEYGAYRQRFATGLEIPNDPETGKPIEPFSAAADRIWSTAAVDAKFGDFEQTDLSGILSSIAAAVAHIASQTRTPPHYLLQESGVLPSGESMRASETALVAKAKRRMRDYGETWEEVMRLAFLADGDRTRGHYMSGETRWRDPEYRTEAEHVDALVKLASLEVPVQQLWEDAGYSPQQIERFEAMHLRLPLSTPKPPNAAEAGGPSTAGPSAAGAEQSPADNSMSQARMEESGAEPDLQGPATRPGSGEEGSAPTV